MKKKTVKVSKNIKETGEIAKIFLNEILKDKNRKENATIVGLSGNLGAGKTAFTQAVAKHLGIKDKVNSPTFVIMKKYLLPSRRRSARMTKRPRHKFFFHFDAYRLKDEKELLNLRWEEIINNKEHLIFIEWPENVKKVIPSHARFIYISHYKNNRRNLELK